MIERRIHQGRGGGFVWSRQINAGAGMGASGRGEAEIVVHSGVVIVVHRARSDTTWIPLTVGVL